MSKANNKVLRMKQAGSYYEPKANNKVLRMKQAGSYMKKQIKKQKRILKGEVVSDKMDKTVVVKVSRLKIHPKYKRRYKITKRFKVHDEKNECHTGDKVIIEETRPLSKEKRWKVKGFVGEGELKAKPEQ